MLFAVTGLFSTGVDPGGAPLGAGAVDQNYTLASASFGGPSGPALAVDPANSPLARAGTWVPNGGSSAWIAPHADQSVGEPAGVYDYRTTFNLTGDPRTARITGEWAADNSAEIFLNGSDTGLSVADFLSLSPFAITGGFVAGTNTLDFVVTNAGTSLSPTGLQVHFSSATVTETVMTTLNVAPAAGAYGGSTTLAATLAGSAGALPGEVVTFSLNGAAVGTATTDAGGIATLPGVALGALPAGAYDGAVTASFAGDSINAPSSGAASLAIAAATASFDSLSSPTILYHAASATVSGYIGAGALAPAGSVTISVNGATMSAPVGPDGAFSASFATGDLPIGSYAISYSYPASQNFTAVSGSGTLTVTYGIQILTEPSDENDADRLRLQIQLVDANGAVVSGLVVTAVGVSPASDSTPTLPAVPASRWNAGGVFRFEWDDGYVFNLKPLDATGAPLPPGTYSLYFTVTGDPVLHSLQFNVGCENGDVDEQGPNGEAGPDVTTCST